VNDRFAVVAALVDRSRRALYDFVRRQNRAVGREEAAEGTGMSRGLAAFHLDKLVDAGLLTARFESPPDQPRGRGRTPKLYEAANEGLAVTIPERRYDLIAEILADAVAEDPARADEAARRLAHRRGHDLGAGVRAGLADPGADPPAEGADTADPQPGGCEQVAAVLARLGFEPAADGGQVRLHNCPFHALASRHTELICGLNQRFISGLVEGLEASGVEARLAPRPGACCVELRGRR
jgi:predicted ArsR family transcriptional regulator